MRNRRVPVVVPGLVLLFTMIWVCGVSADTPRPELPDYGMILNEDGDVVFMYGIDPDPQVVAEKLRENLDSINGTPVDTLVFNIACGSDIMHYPTDVGSRWGWRTVKKEEAEPWATYLPGLRAASAAGLDSVRVAGQWAKENGKLFVPSYRINDSHYAHAPDDNPLTGQFYAENKHLELGASPVPGDTSFARLLDFEREEARAYRLGVMLEVIERYADVMDGFQIDFMRQPIMFKEGRAEEGAELVTQMIREVRTALDKVEAQQGRAMGLMVRVPPTLENCDWSGIDIKRWVQEGLVDVVIPSPGMTQAHDIPYSEFGDLDGEGGFVVGAAVFPRTQFAWPMSRDAQSSTYSGVVGREVSPEQLRGAMSAAAYQGASVIEFYNVNLPLDDYGRTLVMAADSPMSGDRVYSVTPAYYLDHTDTYEYRKQVPKVLEVGEPATLNFYLGDEQFGAGDVMLRLGIRGVGNPSMRIEVQVNGVGVFDGLATGPEVVSVTGKRSRPSSLHPDDPQAYLHIPIKDSTMLKPGENRVTVKTTSDDVRALIEVVEAQLACFSD